jgi:hypothetical protein
MDTNFAKTGGFFGMQKKQSTKAVDHFNGS